MLHERWPDVPRIALTATATEATRREIAERLDLDGARALRLELRPAEHPVPHRAEERGCAAAARLHPHRAPRRRGHRLLPLARDRSRRPPTFLARERHRTPLPYHAGLDAGAARPQPVALPARRRRGRRRDDRVRHGHRQARRALRRPPRPAEVASRATTRRPVAPAATALPSTAWLAYGLQDVVQQRRMIDAARATSRTAAGCRSTSTRCSRSARRSSAAGVQLLGYFGAAEPSRAATATPASRRPSRGTARSPPRSCSRRSCGCSASATSASAPATSSTSCRGRRHRASASTATTSSRTYGIGTDLSEQEWRGVVRQLLAQGLLAVARRVRHARRSRMPSAEVLDGCAHGDAPHASPSAPAALDAAKRRGRRGRPRCRRSRSSRRCASGARARRASRACPPTSSSATRPCAASRVTRPAIARRARRHHGHRREEARDLRRGCSGWRSAAGGA